MAEVGRGAFGIVYLARQVAFDRDVAIKVMPVPGDDETRERFAVECSAIGALSGHPNIVTVYETGTTGDRRPYIVMELLSGGSLGDRLAAEGPLDWKEVVAIGVKLAGALESAHRAGVLHRDVKPENVLLSRFGDAKLADFGMARARLADDESNIPVATLAHAAPETVGGSRATPGSDIYSLASTLHALLSGRAPFVATEDIAWVRVAADVADAPPPDLRGLGVPEQLCTVLEGAMAKEPADRPSDAAQFGRQLQAVEAANDVAITRLPIEMDAPNVSVLAPANRRTRARSFARAHRKVLWLQLVGLVLVVTAVVGLVRPGGGTRTVGLVPIYRDNFDAGEGWYEHSDEVATLGYDAGRYRISVDRPRQQAISDSSFRGSSDGTTYTHLGDVSIQVSAMSPSGTGLFGVTCRQSAQAASYYEGLVGADGTSVIAKYQDRHLLTLARASVAPPSRETMTRIRLDCIGSHGTTRLRLSVDDRRVIDASDKDGLGPGSIGMTVDTGTADRAEASFDDLVVFGHREDRL